MGFWSPTNAAKFQGTSGEVQLYASLVVLLPNAKLIFLHITSSTACKLSFILCSSNLIFQELSPVLFTLLKSTEPFLDEYHLLNLEETVRDTGFVNVTSALSDARHRTLTASVPL